MSYSFFSTISRDLGVAIAATVYAVRVHQTSVLVTIELRIIFLTIAE